MPVMRLVILLVAAGAAIAAALLVRGLQDQPVPVQPIQTIQRAAQPVSVELQKPKQNILVVSEDVRVGTYLTIEHLKWQGWPDNANTTAFYVDAVDPDAMDKLIGAVVRIDMMAGEPLTSNKVVHPGQAGFMSAVLTPGMRAVSMEISADAAAGGFIFPGDRVDVLMLYQVEMQTPDGTEDVDQIDTLLENVRVLAIDGYYRPIAGEEGGSLVGNRATLELTPADSLVLTAADEEGDLALTLRSVGEVDGPSGVTPRWRNFAKAGWGDASGVRVFAGGQSNMAVAPVGSGAGASQQNSNSRNGFVPAGQSQADPANVPAGAY